MRAVRPTLPILLCLALLPSLAAARPARAAAEPEALAAAFGRLDEFVRREMRRQHIPGVSLALTGRDRLLRVKTYGFANLDARTLLTPDHLLEIGSITKSFTSIALLQLRDEGRFDPKAPVTEYLPWFSIESSFEPITPHDLLTHSAALPRDRDDIVSSPYQAAALGERVVGEAPGKHFRYSNIGYQVLTYMLEDPRNISRAMRLQSIAKHLERIGDHATNLAEMVVFMVKGKDIRHGGPPPAAR